MTQTDKKQHWRLIAYAQCDAATNMAIDEAVLETHALALAPPTVRLYCFTPAAVTIGYGQQLSSSDIARIQSEGIEVVRRPTGGRAVLHANDLTYSFVGTALGADNAGSGAKMAADETNTYQWQPFLSPTISGAYKEICQGLIEALCLLGIEAGLGASGASYRQMHDCFLATTAADLHVNGKKMVGSAQLRRNSYVLQHGSILLDQDQQLMQKLLTGAASTDDKTERHANLFQAAGRNITMAELQHCIKAGFEKAFDCQLELGQLSDRERRLAATLRAKYALDSNDVSGAAAIASIASV